MPDNKKKKQPVTSGWEDTDLPVIDDTLSGKIANVESEGGDYSDVNPHTGALGKYQFVPSHHWSDIQKVTGVGSQEEFLARPEAQEQYFAWHSAHNLEPAAKRLSSLNKDGYSDDQLKMLVHFKGEGGAAKWLRDHKDDTQQNNISIPQYLGEPANATVGWADEDLPVIDDPQKKSPVASPESGLATSSPNGQSVSSESKANNVPATPVAHDWSQPQATLSGETAPQGVAQGISAQSGKPINERAPAAEVDPNGSTALSGALLSNYVVQATHAGILPKEYADNLNSTSFTQPGNVAHDVSDPHGNPKFTGDLLKFALSQIDQQKNVALRSSPGAVNQQDIDNQFEQQKQQLRNAAARITSLQMAFQDLHSDRQTGTEAQKQMQGILDDFAPEMEKADAGGKKLLQAALDKRLSAIKGAQKFDAVRLGLQQQVYLGNKQAESDLVKYNNGLPLDISRRVAYQSSGLNILQLAANEAGNNGQQDAAQQFATASDNPEKRLRADNEKFFTRQAGHQLGNYIYNNVDNPIYGTLWHRGKLTPEQIKELGPKAGLSAEDVASLKPEDVPTAASMEGRFLQSAFNTLTFRNENDPGGKFFTGEMPEAQTQLGGKHWLKNALGEMASGAGTVSGAMLQGGAAGSVLKGGELLGDVAANANRYQTVSNLIPIAAMNYNQAYARSKDIVGDDPKDEKKRMLYAFVDGTASTALMSIDPFTSLGEKAISSGAGKDFISLLKNNSIDQIEPAKFQQAVEKMLVGTMATGKHAASQGLIMGANQASQNITRMVFDPEHRGGVMDNVGMATLEGAISMLLPSALAGRKAMQESTPVQRELLWEVGNNPDKYQKIARQQFKDGQMTQDDYNAADAAIRKASNIVNVGVPRDAVISGKTLTDKQQQKYAYNLLQTQNLEDQLHSLEGVNNPDKSQVGLVKGRISELEKERTDILKNAGELDEEDKVQLTPKTDLDTHKFALNRKQNQAPTDKRSVATAAEPETETQQQKKSTTESEKNISSQPKEVSKESSQEKPTENGNVNEVIQRNEERGQDRTSTEEHGQENPNHEEANDRQRRHEQQEGRVLTPEAKSEEPQAASQEQPLPVDNKKRRRAIKIVADEEDQIPTKTDEGLRAVDTGKLSGMPEEEAHKILQKTGIDEKIGETGETPREAIDRIHEAWERNKKEAPQGTLFIQHSGVDKIIKSAEEHGWDNHEKIWQDYLNKPEPEFGKAEPEQAKEGEIMVARHGETEDGANGLMRREDTPLVEAGQDDAKRIAQQLQEEGKAPSQIVSSDLPRAQETSAIISNELAGSNNENAKRKIEDYLANERTVYDYDMQEHGNGDVTVGIHKRLTPVRNSVAKYSKEEIKQLKKLKADLELGDITKQEYSEKVRDLNKQVLKRAVADDSLFEDHVVASSRDKSNQESADKTERRNEVKTESQTPAKKEKNASLQSQKQQQESLKQSGKPEHARTEQAGGKAKTAETENRNSNQRGKKKAEAIKPKKKGKDFDFPAYLKRRDAVLKKEPASIEEHILHTMLSMNDKAPEKKWQFKSLEKDIPKGKEEERIVRQFASDHPKAAEVDRWANDLQSEIEQGHHPFGLDGKDSKDIGDMVKEMVSQFTSKQSLLEHLEQLHADRERPEENIAKIPIVHGDTGAVEHIPIDLNAPDAEEQLASMLDGYDRLNEPHFDDEGHPIFQATNDISNEVGGLSKKDAEIIADIASKHMGSDGKMDQDRFIQELHDQKQKLSPTAQEIINNIHIFEEKPGDNEKYINELKEKAQQYEIENKNEAGTQQDTEGNAGEGSTKERGVSPAIEGGPREEEKRADAERQRVEDQQKREQYDQQKEKPVKSFETSQGSKYEVLPDGRTIRFKAATGEQHEPQDLTVFAKFKDTEQEQRFLSGIQEREQSGTKVYVIDKDGKVYDHNEDVAGKDVRLALVNSKTGEVIETAETKTQPTIGYNTFDQRRFKEGDEEFRESHLGNKVAKINYAEPESKPLSAEERLKFERKAHQDIIERGKKAEVERQAALKADDQEAIKAATDKVNELAKQAQAKERKIEKLANEEKNQSVFNKAADWVEKTYAKNKASHEGEAYATILGLPTKIANYAMDFMMGRIVEGLRELGNREMAIRRAWRLTKEKFGYDDLKDEDVIKKIRESEDVAHPKLLKAEPILSLSNEEEAKDILADIFTGKITHQEAIDEILNEPVLNREGKPVSAQVAENYQAKILNYLDWHIQNDLTSIKNETTRTRREQFGLDEEIPAAHKEFGQTLQEAKDKIASGINPQDLVDELHRKPRPLTDVENAMLLHHQNAKEVQYAKVNKQINKAAEEGNQAVIEENKVAKARLLDELQKIYDVNKAVGTENARGLVSRKMMVDRRYSLVNMLAEKRATANDGKPLTEKQQQEVEQLHQTIKETREAFDNYKKEAESKIIDLQRDALKGPLKDKKTASTKLRQWADRIRNAAKNQAYSSPIPITPHMVADAIDFIADGVEKGEQLVDWIQKAVVDAKKANPSIDEKELESAINKELIDSKVLEPTPERRKAMEYAPWFKDGKLDPEAVRLKVAANRAMAEYENSLKKDQENKLSKWAKAQNFFVKWSRGIKLTNPLTLGKLASAALSRLGSDAIEDVAGAVWSEVFPKLANGAIGEGGGVNAKDLAAGYTGMWMRGFKDAGEIMKKSTHGTSELDALMGKFGDLPPEALDFFGRVHSMIKAPVKRYAFEKSLSKRTRRAINNGVDISDPAVQTSLFVGALKDANRAIFMQDNAAASWFQRQIRSWEKVDPKTGKAPGKLAATTAQWMLPFVKVPTNIVAETARGAYGLPVGAAQALHAIFSKGVLEKLSEDDRDIIMRNLKKGTIGAAAMTLGYMMPQMFGGYYQQNQKRDDKDAKPLGIKIGDTKLPGWLFEAPIFQLMQLGATIHHVMHKRVDGEEEGIGEGVWAGLLGLTENVPMVNQPMRIMKGLATPKERNYFFDELVKGTVVPAVVDYTAKATDPADKRSLGAKFFDPENHRKTPKNLMGHIKSGLPGLREQLPRK